jgi:hypothetical protein
MKDRNGVTLNAMITTYSKGGSGFEEIYSRKFLTEI